MSPREFKEMLNQILRLTPAQKRRLMLGVQKSVKSDELPEQVRQREAEFWTDCEYVRIAVPQGWYVTESRQACVDFVAVRHLADEPFTR